MPHFLGINTDLLKLSLLFFVINFSLFPKVFIFSIVNVCLLSFQRISACETETNDTV